MLILFKQVSPQQSNVELPQTNSNINEISTPNLRTPSTAASESNTFYTKFFPAEPDPSKSQLDLEILKNSFQKEVENFKVFLADSNFANLQSINSTKGFVFGFGIRNTPKKLKSFGVSVGVSIIRTRPTEEILCVKP